MENKNFIATVGLKKIRKAQILHVIAIILAGVGAIALLVGPMMVGDNAMDNKALTLVALGVAGVGGLMSFVGLIIAIVCFVMEIVGMYKASPSHPCYKTALFMVLANIAMGAGSFFVMDNAIFSDILQALSPITVFLSVYFVLRATSGLLREKGDEASAAKGNTVRTIYLVYTAVSVVSGLIFPYTAFGGIGEVVTMMISVVQIVALFMYISFLGRSVQTLSE